MKETKLKSMKASDRLSTLRVLAFAAVVGAFTVLFIPAVSLSPAIAQQTTNATAAGEIPETVDLPQQLLTVTIDNEPLYQSISGNLTSVRIVDVVSPSLVIEEESFVERAFMKDIGNVINTGTYVENIDRNKGIVHGIGKGIITTENRRGDIISCNAYDLGLLSGYVSYNGSSSNATASGLDTERITIYRGIMFFSSDSEKLSFMNNIVGLYITKVNDENGTSLRQIWEWRNNY